MRVMGSVMDTLLSVLNGMVWAGEAYAHRRRIVYAIGLLVAAFILLVAAFLIASIDMAVQYKQLGLVGWDALLTLAFLFVLLSGGAVYSARQLMVSLKPNGKITSSRAAEPSSSSYSE